MKSVLSALIQGAALLGLGAIRRKAPVAGNVRPKNRSRVTGMLALCLSVATVAATTLLPSPVIAQGTSVRYVGTLSMDKSSCSYNYGEIQVDIKGDEISGYYVASAGGRANFKGKMTGSSFSAINTTNNGQQRYVSGKLEDGNLAIRVESGTCKYTAVLKKV